MTPLIHWDFSGNSNADAGTIVEDLTGNGYDLELKNFAFDNESGYNGYPQDLRKTNVNENIIFKSENTLTFTRHTDGFSFYISKAYYNNVSYVMKVHLQDGVESVVLSAYVGPNYADYGLPRDRETLTFYEGINIVPAFSSEFFDNCIYVGFTINKVNTDKEATIEIFPLYPDQLVFENNLAKTIKGLYLPKSRGFTIIYNRVIIDDNQRNILFGKSLDYENYPQNAYIIIEDNQLPEVNIYRIYSYSTFLDINNIIDRSQNIVWCTKRNYNGLKSIQSKLGLEDIDKDVLQIGNYIHNSSLGTGHFAIKEVYVFDRDLTQSQIEKFISDNMIPLPEVYYDVDKQGTLNEHTTKDKLIDFSGNQHHGTLHNFTFLSPGDKGYYPDCVNGFIRANQGIWDEPYLTLNKEDPSYGTAHTILISASETASEDIQVTTPAIKIRVHKIEDCIIRCYPQIDGAGINPFDITSPGDYTVPSQILSVTAGQRYNIFSIIVGSGTQQDILVEILGEGDGWGYQRTIDAFELQSTYHPQGSETSSVQYVVSKIIPKSNFVSPIIVPKYRVKVTGLTEIGNNNKAYIDFGYDIVYTGSSNDTIRFKTIREDGEYEIDTYVLSPSYIDKYDEINFIRPIAISYRYIPTDNNVTIEFLPDEGDCLRFNSSKDTYVSLDTLTKGFKTVFMVSNPAALGQILYDQRINPNNPSTPFAIYNEGIAYNERNNGGVTYINGELNTSITAESLTNVKHCLTIVNDTVTDDDSTTPVIGDRVDHVNGGQAAATMKLYKFLGFKEALSEKQIKMVIEKYGLQIN